MPVLSREPPTGLRRAGYISATLGLFYERTDLC
jgi:hypothetical protein